MDAPFSGLVFKVQANMDPAHRDRVAFVRVCSGRFERGMVLTHAATGRPFATKYAQSMFGQDRETVEEAFPGDVIGLVNATALRPGDTLYAGAPVEFPPIPSFAPEHFAVVRGIQASKQKQFRRGIEQLDTEGVPRPLLIALLRSLLRRPVRDENGPGWPGIHGIRDVFSQVALDLHNPASFAAYEEDDVVVLAHRERGGNTEFTHSSDLA